MTFVDKILKRVLKFYPQDTVNKNAVHYTLCSINDYTTVYYT